MKLKKMVKTDWKRKVIENNDNESSSGMNLRTNSIKEVGYGKDYLLNTNEKSLKRSI